MSILLRGNRTLTVTTWLNVNEFIGQIESPRGTWAAYGWAKDKSFMVYTVKQGHIEKVGNLKRQALDCPLLP